MLLYLDFDWLVSVCHCDCEKKLGQSVDNDWQLLLYSSSSQWIHSVIGQLCVLQLVDLLTSQFQLEFESINPQLWAKICWLHLIFLNFERLGMILWRKDMYILVVRTFIEELRYIVSSYYGDIAYIYILLAAC